MTRELLENVVVLDTDKPNKNGRIYPRVEIEKAIERLPDPFIGFIGMETQGLERTTHLVENLKLNDDGTVTCRIKPVGPTAPLLQQLGADPRWAFRTAGYGTVNDKNEVVDFTFTHVNLVPAEEAA